MHAYKGGIRWASAPVALGIRVTDPNLELRCGAAFVCEHVTTLSQTVIDNRRCNSYGYAEINGHKYAMSANSRLTVATHILTRIALVTQNNAERVTSDKIAASVKTNPVVIRRMLGLLAKAGLVESFRGVNAGWRLAKEADEITLLDVFNALEEEGNFSLHSSPPSQICPIGRSIGVPLARLYESIDDSVREALSGVTIQAMLNDTMASNKLEQRGASGR